MSANGRVNILKQPTSSSVFNLYDKIPIDQKVTSYRNALTGNLESNPLFLQNDIIAGVLKSSHGRFKIGYQDEDTLKIIMRSIYLQHSSNLPNNIREQVTSLNNLVTEYCIPQICGEAEAYIKYKNDVSTLAVPLQRPVSTYHNNLLETTKFF